MDREWRAVFGHAGGILEGQQVSDNVASYEFD